MLVLSTVANANKSIWDILLHIHKLYPGLISLAIICFIVLTILGFMAFMGAIKIAENSNDFDTRGPF